MEPNETEIAIKKAAIKVFLAKGLAGARMQEIADEAGINRTTLHYYYRSKERLFEIVFTEATQTMDERMEATLSTSDSWEEKVSNFIESYNDIALEQPNFDMFIINEFNQNPEAMSKIFLKNAVQERILKDFMMELQQAFERGEINTDPRHFFLNLISLCIFPFAAKTMITYALGLSEEEYLEMLRQRKKQLIEFFLKGVKP